MAKSFLVSDTAVSVTTSWQAVAVTSRGATDPNSQSVPGSMHIWTIEVDVSANGGGATYLNFALTYDSGATKNHSGPSANATLANLTGTKYVAAVSVGSPAVWPTGTTKGTMYVWVKGDNTCTIAANGIRVVWTPTAAE